MTNRASLAGRGRTAVVELIRLRTMAKTLKNNIVQTFLGDPLFESLPSFNKDTITQVSDELTRNSIMNVLQMIWFDYSFSLRDVERYSESQAVRDVQHFEVLYQILGMFWKGIYDPHSISVVVKALCKVIESPFHELGFGMFLNVANVIVENRDVTITDELYEAFIMYVDKEPLADAVFHDVFCGFVEKIVQRGDEGIAEKCLNDVAEMVKEQKRVMKTNDYTRLIPAIARFIERLNPKAVYILCQCARLKENQSIASFFGSFAGLVFNNFQKRPVKIPKDEFNRQYYIEGAADNMVEKELDMPPAELIESSFNPDFSDFEAILAPVYEIPAKSAQMFTEGFRVLAQAIVESAHCVDFCFVLCNIVKRMKNLNSYANLFDFFYNSVTFCESNTVFSIFRLSEEQNAIRNTVFDLFVKDQRVMQSLFYSASASPILMAENLMRLSFKYNDVLKSMMCTESGLSSLISCATTIQQNQFPAYYDRLDLARSITLSVLFGVLEDPETALRSLSCSVFSLGFMSLIYDPALVSLVISAITTCIKRFETLPEPVKNFLVAFYQNCSSVTGDEQFIAIARQLSRAVIEAISHNPKITCYFEPMLDSALEYLARVADKDTLESVLSLLMLMTQKNPHFEITAFRFDVLLAMIDRVDGVAPSQMVMEKLHNILSGSSILKMEREVLIYVPQFISLIIASVSRSPEKLSEIIEYFKDLCRFSIYNIYQCHEGNLSFLLLEGLRGEFTYNDRKLKFEFGNTQGVFELLSMLVSVRSSYKVDMAFIRLIRECNEGALMCLSNILSTLDNEPKPSLPVFQPASLLKIRNYAWKKALSDDVWTLSFYVKIDIRRVQKLSNKFILVYISSADPNLNSSLTLYIYQDRLFLKYDGDGKKYTSPIIPDMPGDVWSLVSLSFRNKEVPPKEGEPTPPMIVIRCGSISAGITKFAIVNFGEKVNMDFAYTESGSVDSQLVAMGPFAFHDRFYETKDLDLLMSNGLAYFNLQLKPFLCNASPCVIRSNSIGTRNMNIYHTLKKHLDIRDILSIFDNADQISQIYLETITVLLAYCAKKAKGTCIFDVDRVFHVLPFSGISTAFWRVHERDRKKMRNSLYDSLFHVFKLTRKMEIFDNILCNFSLWSDEPAMIYRMIRSMNTNCELEDLQRAAIPVLIQSVTGGLGKCSLTFTLLQHICEAKLTEADVSVLFAVLNRTEDEDKFLQYLPCVAVLLQNADVKVPDDRCFSILKFAQRSQKSFDALCDVFCGDDRLTAHLGIDTLVPCDYAVHPESFCLSVIKALIKKEGGVQIPEKLNGESDLLWAIFYALANPTPEIAGRLAKENMESVLNVLWILRAMNYEGVDELVYSVISHLLKVNSTASEQVFVAIFYSLTSETNHSFCEPIAKIPFDLIDFVQKIREFNFTTMHFIYHPVQEHKNLTKLVVRASIDNSTSFLANQNFKTRNTLFEHITVNIAPKYRERLRSFAGKLKNFFSHPATVFNADEIFTKSATFFEARDAAFAEKSKETMSTQTEIRHERFIPSGITIPERKKMNNTSYKKVSFCRILRRTEDLPCMLVFNDDEIIFRIAEKETEVVPFIAVTFVSAVRESQIEIFVGGCESYLLKFEMAHERDSILKVVTSLNLPVLNVPEQKQIVKNNWKNWNISASSYLTALNIVVGRSLNDPNLPIIFPLIRKRNDKFVIMDTVNREVTPRLYRTWLSNSGNLDIEKLFLTVEAESPCLSPEFFICPEFFGVNGPAPSFFESVEDFIYRLNKYLEDQKLKVFLTNSLGLKAEVVEKAKRTVERETKVKAFPFDSKTSLVKLHTFDKYGVCIAIDVNNTVTAYKGKSVLFTKDITSDFLLSVSQTCVLVYSKLSAMLFKITFGSQTQISSVNSHLFVTDILAINPNEMVYVIDESLVYFSDFVNESWLIAKSSEKIGHIGFNSGRRALVYTSKESPTVKTTFLSHSNEFSVSFSDGAIENLLVTRQFGFVVVKCGAKIMVHSLTLKLLKVAEFQRSITMWIDVWVRGVDYVVGVDDQNNVFYFECFCPSEIVVLTRIAKQKVIGLDFNSQANVVIVSTEKQLFSLPFSPR